jgi:DNA primase
LLATLINHPFIFDSVEEDFARLALPDQRLEALKIAVLTAVGGDSTLDSAGLQSHLKGLGYDAELKQVLNAGVYTHAGFARPDAAPEKILAGWQDTIRFMNKRSIWKELRQAEQAFASDFSEENQQRIIGLRDAGKSES